MNEHKLQHGSRINTADEGPLERSVGANIFERLNDGLVSKPVTPSAAAPSAAFALRIDTGRARVIVLGGFGRSPHRHDPQASPRAAPVSWEGPPSVFFPAVLRRRCCPRSWRVGQMARQHHAAEVMPFVETAAGPVRASLSRA